MRFEKSRPIVIVPYKETWIEEFREIKAQLSESLGKLAIRIDHIGSTSVSDLWSKDIIDVQITVTNLMNKAIESALQEKGFQLRSTILHDSFVGIKEDKSSQMRKRFAREIKGNRRAHIHIREAGQLNQRYALLFRDYLRASIIAKDSYQLIKQRLANLFPESIDGYLYIKDPLMDLIFEGAEHWAAKTGWTID